MIIATLHKGKDAALLRRHPWVFSGAIKQWSAVPQDGDVVEVRSAQGEPRGIGHFQQGSIQIRILAFEPAQADTAFWESKLEQARLLRRQLQLPQASYTDCYRLVHAEGDGLPGLVIDVYGRTAVIQCHSAGMYRQRMELVQALTHIMGGELDAIYNKSTDTLPASLQAPDAAAYLWGQSQPTTVREHGHTFFIDWETGQKTGFFLDQRDNRRLLAQYAKDKTVLNAFSYTGGFSVYALAAGARYVHSIDASASAIRLADQNAALNGFDATQHTGIVANVLKYLQESAPGQYDLMVLDPPAFAKSIDKRHNAIQAYKRLNALALQRIRPGGMLFTFSCSQVVDKDLFYHTITAAALEADRPVRVLHHLRQPPDHPVSIFHPEGEYLKGLVLEVG